MPTRVSMSTNTTPQRLLPLLYSNSLSRDGAACTGSQEAEGRGVHEIRGNPEALDAKERQGKAARKREQARRHLSNSLQGIRTVLPDLRRTQSFSVPVSLREQGKAAIPRRETRSLGPRKPLCDQDAWAGLRRTNSVREGGNSKDSSFRPLSLSLPQTRGNISLTALVHQLNASMHHSTSARPPSLSDSDDSIDDLLNYENGLDPDLCPRLTGQDTCDTLDRTLTPALRKLNRRRVSSRVRTQQWVNQIEGQQHRSDRRKRDSEVEGGDKPRVDLLYEQET